MTELIVNLIALAVIVGIFVNVLPFLTKRKSEKPSASEDVIYSSHEMLMSPAEAQTFRVLHKMLAQRGYICPKVRISDLVKVSAPGNASARMRAFSSISQKHVDFAIMTVSGKIIMAIEVDDASHDRPKVQARDALVNMVFDKAGIPLIRVKPGHAHLDENLKSAINRHCPAPKLQKQVA